MGLWYKKDMSDLDKKLKNIWIIQKLFRIFV